MKSKYESLYNYLKLIQSKHNISICINDFTGFIPLDKDLDLVMQNFMIHGNDYCMLVKTEGNFMESCLNMKKGILLKCLKTREPFYGVCHAGVGEFIYPIFHEDKLLGILNVGVFQNNNSINNYFFKKVCKSSKLPINKVSSTFHSNMKDILPEFMQSFKKFRSENSAQ